MNEDDAGESPKLSEQDGDGIKAVRDDQQATPKPAHRMRSRLVQGLSVIALVLVLLLLWHVVGTKSDKAANRPHAEVVPVEMAAATQTDVPIQIKSIGNVEAQSTIAVRSQVEGTLLRVGFVPGQEVKKGAVLFTIDPRPLQAQLSTAEANLLKAMAAVRQGNDIVARDEATAANDRVVEPLHLGERRLVGRGELQHVNEAIDNWPRVGDLAGAQEVDRCGEQ